MFWFEGFIAGRIWAGYGILEFDCQRIREAFSEIGRNPPEPKRIIDLLGLLTQRFGSRAGDMKVIFIKNCSGKVIYWMLILFYFDLCVDSWRPWLPTLNLVTRRIGMVTCELLRYGVLLAS